MKRCYSLLSEAVRRSDLEHHVHEQPETVLARVFAGDVGGREINQVGAGLGTDGMDQHLLAGAPRSCQ